MKIFCIYILFSCLLFVLGYPQVKNEYEKMYEENSIVLCIFATIIVIVLLPLFLFYSIFKKGE